MCNDQLKTIKSELDFGTLEKTLIYSVCHRNGVLEQEKPGVWEREEMLN